MNKKILIGIISVVGLLLIVLAIFLYLFFSSRYIVFDKKIIVNRPTTEVWQDFSLAFSDSTKTDFWPTSLSAIKSTGLRKNAPIQVDYLMGKSKTSTEYVITDLVIGQKIQYQTNDDHPLIGMGTIYFVNQGDKTQINWKGEFGLQDFSFAGIYVKYYYLNNFFETLENNLQ